MKWIPYQKLVITTNLSRKELIEEMKKYVGPLERKNLVRVDNNIFSGRLRKNKFEFNLSREYRNSWRPIVYGTLEEKGEGVVMYITLRSHMGVLIFTGFFILVGFILFCYELMQATSFNDLRPIGLLFMFFGYFFCWFGYNMGAYEAIDGLLKISKGEIIN